MDSKRMAVDIVASRVETFLTSNGKQGMPVSHVLKYRETALPAVLEFSRYGGRF